MKSKRKRHLNTHQLYNGCTTHTAQPHKDLFSILNFSLPFQSNILNSFLVMAWGAVSSSPQDTVAFRMFHCVDNAFRPFQ